MSTVETDGLEEETLQYLVTHIFCPLKLPDGDDHSLDNDRALSNVAHRKACDYSQYTSGSASAQWPCIVKMLQNLNHAMSSNTLDEALVISQIHSMQVGDVLVYIVRAQNAAVTFRRQPKETLVESFEVSPRTAAVMSAAAKLVCSYPGPAITVPNIVFDDETFCKELANFLSMMDKDVLAPPTTRKAGSEVVEERDTAHPRYITELLTGILRAVGRPADIERISKRIGDDVVWKDSKLPWRRSSLWLVIRVALQITLDRNGLGRTMYKTFMLFLMNDLARQALLHDMSNDVLQWISAKLSRRLAKLAIEAPDWLSDVVLETCVDIRTLLNKRWTQVQADETISLPWNPLELDFSADTQLTLLNSSGYISNALQTQCLDCPSSSFDPKKRLRGTLEVFLSVDKTFFQRASNDEPYVTLYDLEREVGEGIDNWVARIPKSGVDDACERLEFLASSYAIAAKRSYAGNPEDSSRMLLTVIEFWIALDKLVVEKIPILRDYSPEVPVSLLERLIIRDPLHLRRLPLAVGYIRQRARNAQEGRSVFSDTVDEQSFAVRYFDESLHLQSLRDRILDRAGSEREIKCRELENENERYANLYQKAFHTSHTYTTNQYGWLVHDYQWCCPRCTIDSEMQRMKIALHEWPLPTDPHHVARVIFELECPISFNMWRSTILHLVELCSSSVESVKPYLELHRYSGLQGYYQRHSRSRVTLASDTKPFIQSHYGTTRIPAEESEVCVNNGLTFYGFDTKESVRTSEPFKGCDISSLCAYQLPTPGPYQNLQHYLKDTTHTSNEVLCNQANCHKDLSIHEFIAFGHLRSGPFLQWLNMLREIRANTLRFRRDEIHFLFAQASCQVGPVSVMGRLKWHDELSLSLFRRSLLRELEVLATTMAGNWLEAVTMATIVVLVSRMLATDVKYRDTDAQALDLLRKIREQTFSWVLELSRKLEDANDADGETLRRRLRDVAAICRSTFEVGSIDVRQLLQDPKSLEILLSCAIIIHNNTSAKSDATGSMSRLLISRDRRLAWKLERMVCSLIEEGHDGISAAVKRVCAAYHGGEKWKRVALEGCCWFTSNTSASEDQQSQEISLNIFDGTLLVDGRPLGRLPLTIQKDSLFTSIFRDQVLVVGPGDMAGMQYATHGFISEHRVYFGTVGNELVIKAKKREGSDVFQLIPPRKLTSDLPRVLIEKHVHWLNLSTQSIEIRPLTTLWQSSPDNWCIQFASSGGHVMRKGRFVLFDIRSPTWEMVSELLKPLQDPQDLVITRDEQSSTVSVDLLRCGLSFFINSDGELESRHPRNMVYDEDQSIGTLFGLVNKLVLRSKDNFTKGLFQRQVLIPEGKVDYENHQHHVKVTVDVSGPVDQNISYQTFRIDTELGGLVGNSGLPSNLYRAYLHAVCSNPCAIDPLTRKTGTEEALTILCSAAVRSFLKINRRAAELLESISSLTTRRQWYPAHLRCMQTVHWENLPPASQHHGFHLSCSVIKKIHSTVQVFHDNSSPSVFRNFLTREDRLLRRIGLRAALLDPPEHRGVPYSKDDTIYKARDAVTPSDEVRAYNTARAVYSGSLEASKVMNIRAFLESWEQYLEGAITNSTSLRYSREWLSCELRPVWLSLYNTCRSIPRDQRRFQLLFTLPAMVYASPGLEEVAFTLLAFATIPQFEDESPPPYPTYCLSHGYAPSPMVLYNCVSSSVVQNWSPEDHAFDWWQLQRDTDILYGQSIAIWPHRTPPPLYLFNPRLYDLGILSLNVECAFETWYQNWELKQHLDRIQQILEIEANARHTTSGDSLTYTFVPSEGSTPVVNQMIALTHLLHQRAAPVRLTLRPFTQVSTGIRSPGSDSDLGYLIDALRQMPGSSFHTRLAEDLQFSKSHFVPDNTPKFVVQSADQFAEHFHRCRSAYLQCLTMLAKSLLPQTRSERAIFESGQWPRSTVKDLLGCLASNSGVALPPAWRDYLMSFTKLTLEYQRSRRLLLLAVNRQHEDLCKEMENIGFIGWNAESHPDWLLLQLEGNFLIRDIQVNVASEMISPRSGKNTALQLHMGEGKSSVIVPMVALDLADGEQLVRVVVPKALTAQMFHILVDRLGGLTNRRIYHLPFSRSLRIDPSAVKVLQNTLEECSRERGILVVQPDHILSCKLLSVEKQLQGDQQQVASRLLQTQQWLQSHARDILDESDEILHVRNQLVYTTDVQRPLEGSPHRWTTAQQVLGLVRRHAAALYSMFPLGVEYEERQNGTFPRIRLLHSDAASELIHLISKDIMDGLLPDLNITQASQTVKNSIHTVITVANVKESDVKIVREYSGGASTWTRILHLRGLLASGILCFALTERRWRVGFGLAPSRTMLAVPYRAKDVPAARAEFGHPDVAVVLTCLSYYYQGLDKSQLTTCFELLLQLDNPDLEYELWVRDWPAAPHGLRQVSGINIKSVEQWNEYLFPIFSCNQATIDFYLSRRVFQKEAKEFPFKLSSSGWDLAEEKEHVTTGFSGTNDSRYLLPTPITQQDPDHQRGTNAKVLAYLLQPENDGYMQISWGNGKRRTAREFLELLVAQKPEIRVVLDVGAQVLELTNRQFAEAWLELKPVAKAAIYFNEDDELSVLTQEGTTQLLLESTFSRRLDECVVYLDDAHTRGTDIEFSIDFRAAVTLGPKVTKDRLTQGCMRMRKLGHGHSVMFFAPLDVDRAIRAVASVADGKAVHASDILLWTMHETCMEIQNRALHWAQQGTDHTSRYEAWSKFCRNEIASDQLAIAWRQRDVKTLEEMYAPTRSPKRFDIPIAEIRQRCLELGVFSLPASNMDEEQEREVVHEIERERQAERPPSTVGAEHRVIDNVRRFVRTGILDNQSNAFIPIFNSFQSSNAPSREEGPWTQGVLATSDFCRVLQGDGDPSEYLRPVNWVLSKHTSPILVILSPFEANELLSDIRRSKEVQLHIYTPRVQKMMVPCDDSDLYAISYILRNPTTDPKRELKVQLTTLHDQLNLFAGQLYLRDYETYVRLCRFLCVYTKDLEDEGDFRRESDGFILPAHRPPRARSERSFSRSPLPFLRFLIELRRKGIPIALTHMGKILDGRLVREEDFEA